MELIAKLHLIKKLIAVCFSFITDMLLPMSYEKDIVKIAFQFGKAFSTQDSK